MAARSFEFWPSLERNFSGIGCTLEATTTVSSSTYCYLFIGDSKKYTVSGVTFFFKTPGSHFHPIEQMKGVTILLN